MVSSKNKNSKKSKLKYSRKSSNSAYYNNYSEYIDEQKNEPQFFDFYINNNIKNKKSKLKNNLISTTKYNIFTFLPLGLFYQFARLSNIYFLFTAIIQSIPIISPLSSLTAIIPLIFVLGVSLIRELIEDIVRNNDDSINNNEEVIVYRNNEFIHSTSKTLRNGEIVLIKENRKIPADMVLICSGLKDGACYVETSSLDGEKNLKLKITNKNMQIFFSEILKNNFDPENLKNVDFKGSVHVLCPDANLNQIDGNVYLMCQELYNGNDVTFPITPTEFLLKGSILKNTNWIYGIVIYTGMNNKIVLNSRKPRLKMSKTEISMNYCLIGVFCFLVCCCIVASVLHKKNYNDNKSYYENFLLLNRKINTESFLTFFTYFLLLNTMIPISLIVTIEIIKIFQGIFIEWDVKLYSSVRRTFCKAKTVSINEELGNVNFIFSDKTGTLTKNQLQFRFCIIGNNSFEYHSTLNKRRNSMRSIRYLDTIKFDDNFFLNQINKKEEILKKFAENGNKKINFRNEINKKDIENELEEINNFWLALALTNECMVNEDKGDIKYTGTSPDDLELVKAAAKQGYKLLNTSIDEKIIKIGNNFYNYKILKVLAFSSDRKRMSIIIKEQSTNKIKLFLKGAEIEVKKRIKENLLYTSKYKYITEKSEFFSKEGYRTLLVAYKNIQESEYISWVEKFYSNEMDEMTIQEKNKIIDKCYEIMENNLEILGATIVEDKLQEKVPETIQGLKAAGIKVWVLTGDKMSTVESIALSCNLLTNTTKIFKLDALDGDIERVKNDCYSEITSFFEDFQEYLNYLSEKYNQNYSFSKKHKKKNILNINNNNSSSPNSNSSDDDDDDETKIINWEIFHSLKSKNFLEPFSIIINSSILCGLFKDEDLTDKFLQIGCNATTVICCRVSPFQKSQVVQKMKNFDKSVITLAIGDGGNDVSMIMEANIGIGIYGEEGMSAAQASDFAIGEFQCLQRLLFFHGRTNLYRISNLILYFFYKNFVFTMEQFFFSIYCLSSGQTLIDDWYITCYNLIFTSLPLCVSGLTDFDVRKNYGENDKDNLYDLYRESRDNKRVFTVYSFIFNVIKGTIVSFILFFFSIHYEIWNQNGYCSDLWQISLKNYISVLIVVTINLLLRTKYIVLILPLVILISTFLFLILFLLLVHYGLIFSFNSKATIFPTLTGYKFYLYVFLFSGMNFIIDYFIKAYNVYFNDGLVSKFEKNKVIKKEYKPTLPRGHVSNSRILKNDRKNFGNSNKFIKGDNLYKDKGMENSNLMLMNSYSPDIVSRRIKDDMKKKTIFNTGINDMKSEIIKKKNNDQMKFEYREDSTNLQVSNFKTKFK